MVNIAVPKQSVMQLIYNQEIPRIKVKHGHKLLYALDGEEAYLTFIMLEMGSHTQIYQKLSEGRSEQLIEKAREHKRVIRKLEKTFLKQ